ncbi:hypothetical protein FACS189443_1790 [Planctomycetales bacterium]|nr:hypothetical protein FACS189443_1790 [Planctomycetales bacterium]
MFSTELQNWLSANADFVNAPVTHEPLGGRSLGPASGVLGDLYPFLALCPYTGLFAGLSITGLPLTDTETRLPLTGSDVRVLEWTCRTGFRGGYDWRNMSSSDWLAITPAASELVTSKHTADIRFRISERVFDTSEPEWLFHTVSLGTKYRQCSWELPKKLGENYSGFVVTVVTFTGLPEYVAPFLRPQHVVGESAQIDPASLFYTDKTASFYEGDVVIRGKDGIEPAVDGNKIIFNRPFTEDNSAVLKTVNKVAPNVLGNLSIESTGCHKFLRYIDEITDNGDAILENGINIQNTCGVCCACDEYVELYESLRPLFEQQETLIQKYNEMASKLPELLYELDRLMKKKSCLIRVVQTEFTDLVNDNPNEEGRQRIRYNVMYSSTTKNTHVIPSMVLMLKHNGTPADIIKAVKLAGNVSLPVSGGNITLPPYTASFVGTKPMAIDVYFRSIGLVDVEINC